MKLIFRKLVYPYSHANIGILANQNIRITRMKTSISSKAFCSITDRQTNKIFTEYMLIYEGNLHKKIGAISQLGAEKITFPPKRG